MVGGGGGSEKGGIHGMNIVCIHLKKKFPTEDKVLTALKCMAHFLTSKPKKKDTKEMESRIIVPYILWELPVSLLCVPMLSPIIKPLWDLETRSQNVPSLPCF